MKFKRKFKKILKNKTWYLIVGVIVLVGAFFSNCENTEGFRIKNIFNLSSPSNKEETSKNISEDLQVHFVDVGKADFIYIKFKNHNIIIDAADKEPNNIVTEYLKKQDVSKIDLAVVSHAHRDHIGQMAEVIKSFSVEKFIMSKIPESLIPTGRTYEKMLRALKEKEVNSKIAKAGESFEIEDLKIEVLGPVKKGKNLNDTSLVLKMTYKNVSFLFTGDAEKAEESDIIDAGYNLKVDVLKVGHHGSRTSSSENFLKKVSPKFAVISVGPDKSNLPKEEILKRIEKYCKNIHRTDLNGNIIISTNGKNIKVKDEKQ